MADEVDGTARLRALVKQWRERASHQPLSERYETNLCADELDAALLRLGAETMEVDHVHRGEKVAPTSTPADAPTNEDQPSMRVLLEAILADKSAYPWHTAIRNTLALQLAPSSVQATTPVEQIGKPSVPNGGDSGQPTPADAPSTTPQETK